MIKWDNSHTDCGHPTGDHFRLLENLNITTGTPHNACACKLRQACSDYCCPIRHVDLPCWITLRPAPSLWYSLTLLENDKVGDLVHEAVGVISRHEGITYKIRTDVLFRHNNLISQIEDNTLFTGSVLIAIRKVETR